MAASVLTLLILSSCAALGALPSRARAEESDDFQPKVIRIAAPYYDDVEETKIKWQRIFDSRFRTGEQYFSIQVVVGTYDEVLHWYQNEMVDMAMLPPGAVADLMTPADEAASRRMERKLRESYVSTYGLLPEEKPQPLLPAEAKARPVRPRTTYRAYCVAAAGETDASGRQSNPPITNYQELLTLARNNKVDFLFVHPLSVSGRILPEYLLRKEGVSVNSTNVEWTYNHELSLKKLNEKKSDRVKVAFIWDAITLGKTDEKQLDVGNLPKFVLPSADDEYLIPQDILVRTPGFDSKFGGLYPGSRVEELFRKHIPAFQKNFVYQREWLNDYKSLLQWTREIKKGQSQGGPNRHALANPAVDLDQIMARLRNYSEAHPSRNGKCPVRLAVVLSGGGAKCAYQLGVVEALESRLEKLKRERKPPGVGGAGSGEEEIDINLVVGTSGGAINALSVALGLARDEADRQRLRDTWRSFNQGDFFRLWPRVHVTFGLGLGLLQAVAIIMASMTIKRWRDQWWKAAAVGILVFMVFNLFLAMSSWTPWDFLGSYGSHHLWHHLWLVLTISVGWSTVCLFMIGGTLRILGKRLASESEDVAPAEIALNVHRRKVVLLIAAGCALAQILWFVFLFQESALSTSSEFKQVLARKFSALLIDTGAIKREELEGRDDKLKYLSWRIINGGLLKRDLIITGSRLPTGDEARKTNDDVTAEGSFPMDLYFYYSRDPRKSDNPPDNRFVPLTVDENQNLLFDIVVGSSTIYPLFPPQELKCVKQSYQDECRRGVQLIDGGFVHNSPIEAAVRWGATHIIVIEASPAEQPIARYGLLDNSFAAFNYLFSQAQGLDARMYGEKEIFIIRPNVPGEGEEPNLDTFDFAAHLIDSAVDRGLNDAMNVNEPRFRRVLSKPAF